MKNFKKHIKKILDFEGGYVWHKDDLGMETNYGISSRAYPNLNIKKLRRSQAEQIYYKDYWLKAKCQDLPDNLQLMHFDGAVNHGVSRANRILQKAIGTVVIDGVIGSKTIAASSTITRAELAVERCLFYAKIVKHNPSQIVFIVGWIRRVKKVINDD